MTITDYLLLINWDQIPSSPASYWIPFNKYLLHVNTGNMWGYKVKMQFLPSKELTVYRDWCFMYRNTYVIYRNIYIYILYNPFPSGTLVENPPAMQEAWETQFQYLQQNDPLGVGNDNPLQYSCLENSTETSDRLQFMGPPRVGHDWVSAQERCNINIYICNIYARIEIYRILYMYSNYTYTHSGRNRKCYWRENNFPWWGTLR